ncbi:MAG: undecaprenyldiphospho-muramoylpentapeptide beta-N-acetylglucosaminyltransferase [Bacteroidota bacterium]
MKWRRKLTNSNSIRIIFSGGGTGGHIFPAIAIAREIKEMKPDADILFVGASGKMEMEKVPKAGFPITGLPVSAFHRRLTLKNLLFPFRLAASLIKAGNVIRKFNPDLVIGTGGFASGPVLRVATRRRIPSLIQEQNSFPGVTNRLVAHKVSLICVAYPGMEKYFPADTLRLTGNPVRTDLVLPPERKTRAAAAFGLNPAFPVVLVFGGSLGARTLNLCIAAQIRRLAKEPVQIIWQTGTAFQSEASQKVNEAGAANIRVLDFIYNMNEAYAAAGLVVCRSGAITLSELALVAKPAILVPYPAAAEDHQTKNARVYADAGAAILVPDHEAEKTLVDTLLRLVANPAELSLMSEKVSVFAKPEATRTIASLALSLITRHSSLIKCKICY